ncbi:MAG: tRNA (guanosine(37)-N1)-methyltransferase TrmD [Acidobacteria bacterium]|nr:tRNA (guanosine(37)-N1)-methyltransferase TrmD [Acidobacteriota bacterium]
MRFDVLTIFPEMFPGPLAHGVIGKALDRGLAELHSHDVREYADPPHWQVDDEPFGGGAGMVFKPEPLVRAIEAVEASVETSGPVIFLSPQGERLTHQLAKELAVQPQLTMVCGRYEGVDQRVRDHAVDREVSIGDYVLTGGEIPAMVLIETVLRLVPTVLGDPTSAQLDSFVEGALDHPHYTRPAQFRDWRVPEVLRSGDHGRIAEWRREQALRITVDRRPDLLPDVELSASETRFVERCLAQKSDREDA